MTLPLSAPSRTVIVAFFSCALLIASSQSPPLALDAHPPLDTPDDVVCQPVEEPRVEIGDAGGAGRGARLRWRRRRGGRDGRRPRGVIGGEGRGASRRRNYLAGVTCR